MEMKMPNMSEKSQNVNSHSETTLRKEKISSTLTPLEKHCKNIGIIYDTYEGQVLGDRY